MSLKVSISGIRGLYPDDLSEQLVLNYVNAFCSIQDDGDIIIGYDGRSHGSHILEIIRDSIIRNNRHVVNVGLVPTPSIQFLTNRYNNFSGAIMVTASHNPIEWNGMKFMDSDGCFISKTKFSLLVSTYNKLISQNNKSKINFSRGKELSRLYSIEEHIDHTINLDIIPKEDIINNSFSVTIDTINGAGSKAIPMLLEKLNCSCSQINFKTGVPYPRDPEPRKENLTDFSIKVKENKSDIGFATDPDADRLCLVNEKGSAINEEMTLSLCTDFYYMKTNSNKAVATNLSTTKLIDDIASMHKSHSIRSAVGEINVVNLMKEHGIDFGGEGNGGIIYRQSHLGRDSIVGASLILSYLSYYKEPISKSIDKYKKYYMVKEKINADLYNIDTLNDFIKSNYKNASVNYLDGVKIVINDDSWVHIRSSNTEPIIRIIAESDSIKKTNNLIDSFKESIC